MIEVAAGILVWLITATAAFIIGGRHERKRRDQARVRDIKRAEEIENEVEAMRPDDRADALDQWMRGR